VSPDWISFELVSLSGMPQGEMRNKSAISALSVSYGAVLHAQYAEK